MWWKAEIEAAAKMGAAVSRADGTRGKVQIDVKEAPYCCLRGAAKRNGKHLYQWTAIDECTRIRFVYGFEEHTPENSVKFLKVVQEAFPFQIQTIQTDNSTAFTYKLSVKVKIVLSIQHLKRQESNTS